MEMRHLVVAEWVLQLCAIMSIIYVMSSNVLTIDCMWGYKKASFREQMSEG